MCVTFRPASSAFISSNWRGEPLRDCETVVRLIAETTTAKGLTVTCRLDRRRYPVGTKVFNTETRAAGDTSWSSLTASP